MAMLPLCLENETLAVDGEGNVDCARRPDVGDDAVRALAPEQFGSGYFVPLVAEGIDLPEWLLP
jgi:hypothetical protein